MRQGNAQLSSINNENKCNILQNGGELGEFQEIQQFSSLSQAPLLSDKK